MNLHTILARACALPLLLALGACATVGDDGRTLFPETRPDAFTPERTQAGRMLQQLPPPSRPVAVAVYGFVDQTGQYKASEVGSNLSRAVSQGGGSILVKALDRHGYEVPEGFLQP